MVEGGLQIEINKVNNTFEEYGFKFKNNETLINTMENNVIKVQEGISDLRDYVAFEYKRYITQITETNKEFVEE